MNPSIVTQETLTPTSRKGLHELSGKGYAKGFLGLRCKPNLNLNTNLTKHEPNQGACALLIHSGTAVSGSGVNELPRIADAMLANDNAGDAGLLPMCRVEQIRNHRTRARRAGQG